MKKRSLILVVLLCLGLFFQFMPNEVEANIPLRLVKKTACFDQGTGQLSGYSNDCISGEGGCKDNGCPDGHAEGELPEED